MTTNLPVAVVTQTNTSRFAEEIIMDFEYINQNPTLSIACLFSQCVLSYFLYNDVYWNSCDGCHSFASAFWFSLSVVSSLLNSFFTLSKQGSFLLWTPLPLCNTLTGLEGGTNKTKYWREQGRPTTLSIDGGEVCKLKQHLMRGGIVRGQVYLL